MSVFADTKETFERFGQHVDAFKQLFTTSGLSIGHPKDIFRFVIKLREREFRRRVVQFGNEILKREPGKLGLPVLFTIIALAIGGIGIAGMGSAVGVPVALLGMVLASLGFTVGQEIDSVMAARGASEEVQQSNSREAAIEAAAANSMLLSELNEIVNKLAQTLILVENNVDHLLSQNAHVIEQLSQVRITLDQLTASEKAFELKQVTASKQLLAIVGMAGTQILLFLAILSILLRYAHFTK